MESLEPDPIRPGERQFLRAAMLVGALLSLAAGYLVASQSLVIGSAEGGWRYGYGAALSMRIAILFLATGAVAVSLLFVFSPSTSRHRWLILSLWIVTATALHFAIRSSGSFTLEQLFVSPGANAFFTVARNVEPADVLGRFNWVREHGPLHAQSNMPGKVMLVYALQALSRRTDVLPWLLVAISNLGAVFMYLFVRDLFDDGRVALFSGVLYLFVPARIFFFPLMNTITPVLILCCAWLLLRWLRTARTFYAVVMGIALYGLVFFEPLPLAMGVLFAALSVRAIVLGQIAWDRFAAQTVLMLLVFVATAEAVAAATGFSLFAAFRDIGRHAVAFNEAAGRPYRIWIAANLREFLFGMGTCQAVLFAGALVYSLRDPARRAARIRHPLAVVCLSLAAVLVAIDLIGVNRGEAIRLWIFLACFFQIPAAYVCAALGGRVPIAVTIVCSLLHAVLGVAMIQFVVP